MKILNIDGKDRIQPVIEADERYQEQMQQMQQQLEQMQMQMQDMQKENQSLRKNVTNTTNNLARVAASKGGVPTGTPVASPENPVSAIVNQARDVSAPNPELPT